MPLPGPCSTTFCNKSMLIEIIICDQPVSAVYMPVRTSSFRDRSENQSGPSARAVSHSDQPDRHRDEGLLLIGEYV